MPSVQQLSRIQDKNYHALTFSNLEVANFANFNYYLFALNIHHDYDLDIDFVYNVDSQTHFLVFLSETHAQHALKLYHTFQKRKSLDSCSTDDLSAEEFDICLNWCYKHFDGSWLILNRTNFENLEDKRLPAEFLIEKPEEKLFFQLKWA